MTIKLPASHCPACRAEIDAADSLNTDQEPDLDSVTLCLYCGAVLKWDPLMRLELVTREELRAMDPQTFMLLALAQRAIFRFKAERN